MERPQHECDLVMKGGITSGVVYPRAVVELAKVYCFRNIGGTSAGAIAAGVTAAAEYGRDKGGFERVASLPETLADTLIDKFQPHPELAPLFQVLLASMSGKAGRILGALLTQYAAVAWLWAIPGLAAGLAWWWVERSIAAPLLGIVIAILGYGVGICRAVIRQITKDLPARDFGLCGGLSEPGASPPALTNWLADLIDTVAGRDPAGSPLGVADLAQAGIVIQTVTTDVTSRRPYALPMGNNLHFFSVGEFRSLFPRRVVDHMVAQSAEVGVRDLRYFKADNLPLVVLVRMSLSFPGLISAVPLWRRDFTLVNVPEDQQYVRCLFSDGGLSSNFPITFFDRLLPGRPTFGISLGHHDPRRSTSRVLLPAAAGQGQLLPTKGFAGLGGFLAALIDSAKDWQDTLQSVLPGYRERIVTVDLADGEGGLNLEMDRDIILHLTQLGEQAGREVVGKFALDEHRWRRYLVEVRALDELLRQFAAAWASAPEPGALAYPDIASSYQPQSYAGLTKKQRATLRERAELVAQLGGQFEAMEPLDSMTTLPVSRSRLRVVARMED